MKKVLKKNWDNMKEITCIYVIKDVIEGKYYVSSAINYIKRCGTHKNNLIKNKHHSIKLQNAWNKYGPESFIFEIIQTCEKTI